MMNHTKDYKNLIGFLLGPIRERPGMYLGKNEISCLANIIIGYSIGHEMGKSAESSTDTTFVDFLKWYENKNSLPRASYWKQYFLNEANQNETLALELFFRHLEEYNNEINAPNKR